MKRTAALMLITALLTCLTACSLNLTDREGIIRLYERSEKRFTEAAETGNFESLERIIGVRDVEVRESGSVLQAEIYCGGSGFGSGTHYYGILYANSADFENSVAANPDEWSREGVGYRYTEAEGDNTFYYEPLGDEGSGYYYFEEHY